MPADTRVRPASGGVDAPDSAWRELLDAAYSPAFPEPALVRVGAAAIYDAGGFGPQHSPRRPGAACEGPRYFVTVSPGSLRFRRADEARYQRRLELDHDRRGKRVAEGAAWLAREDVIGAERVLLAAGVISRADLSPGHCDPLRPGKGRSRITEWSAQSRARMTARLLTLDYRPLYAHGAPAMATLTMPDGWEDIAPDGETFKRLVRNFGKRFERGWGRPLVGVWKLEFQRRGAPHLHMLICPPSGRVNGLGWREWYARAWAEVLGVEGDVRDAVVAVHRHPSACANYAEGLRYSDPQKIAVYFNKHGLLADKDYQHVVPALWREPGKGPGRFWGVWGLDVVESSAEVTQEEAVRLARAARKLAAAQNPVCVDQAGNVAGGVRIASVWRVDRRTGKVRRRKVKRRVRRLRGTWGFLAVNDGAAFAWTLARSLEQDGLIR